MQVGNETKYFPFIYDDDHGNIVPKIKYILYYIWYTLSGLQNTRPYLSIVLDYMQIFFWNIKDYNIQYKNMLKI